MLSNRIRRLIAALGEGLLEKEETLRLTLLAAAAGENTFLYGPPGVAKSLLARRISFAFRDAKTFEYLLGRFTTPEELFGPVSISRLKDADRFERVVDGFLPNAEIVFLDEIWNASSPILNTLLTAINEHRFRNGSEELHLPLRTVIGAAGQLVPEEPGLRNLWDRFLLRLPVSPVQGADAFIRLLHDTDPLDTDPVVPEDKISADELDEWTDARDAVTIPSDVASLIVDIRERIARHNSMTRDETEIAPIEVSDRRWRQAARLLRTSALLNDRAMVDALDCIILRHCLWSQEADIPVVNTIIEEALRRYTTSGRFDPDSMRRRLDRALEQLHGATTTESEEEATEPVQYRGEYYRIDAFVDDHIALIWIVDFENLSENETQDTDVFFYGERDDYAYSERLPARRLSDDSVEIDGQVYSLETRPVRRTVQHRVDPAASQQQDIRQELAAIQDEVAAILESIAGYRRITDDEAVAHLFVHRSYAEMLASGMAEAERVFALLQTDVNAALSSLEESSR
ncbi:MAG TPA: AAA family ATPase [Alkalispirochaeta sp.]|nr:AAA family ATPase [Alkalispirochaeta sp.]